MEETKSDSGVSVLEDVFTVHYPTCSPVKCQVTLTSEELILEEHEYDESDSDVGRERYKIEDIFGLHVVEKESEEPSIPTVYVCIIFYTRKEDNNSVRARVPRILEINKSQHSYKANLQVANEWALEIGKLVELKFSNLLSHELQQNSSTKLGLLHEKIERAFEYLRESENSKNDAEYDDDRNGTRYEDKLNLDFYEETFTFCKTLLFERLFLVIINPVSGQGKGSTLFQEQISPVFADSGIKIHLVETEFAGHASNTIRKFDLSRIDGIVSVGGDGLLNEIVNGIRIREDAQKFVDIPIGVIATGSGNGLARTIAAYYGASQEYRANPVLHSTLSVARGCVSPVNLTEVSLDKRKFYSFLSVGWGLLSDIDIESEVLRYIGEIRFFIWSFIRLFQLRRYKAELSYVPHDAKGSISSRVIVNDDFVSVYSACQSHIGSDLFWAPDAKPFDSIIHLTYLPSDTGRIAAAKFLAELIRDQGQHIKVNPVKYVKVKEFTIRCEGGIQGCLTVDGEQVKGEEITVKVCDRPLFIFAMG